LNSRGQCPNFVGLEKSCEYPTFEAVSAHGLQGTLLIMSSLNPGARL
jgi:hypothetical protein